MRKLFAFILICGSLYSKSQVICGGGTATLSATNPSNLASPQYSMQQGGFVSPGGTFVVSPSVTTTYTLYTTGTTGTTVATSSIVVTVTVNPQPSMAPTFTQLSCTQTLSAFNLNLTFNPGNPAPSFTVTWGGSPVAVIPPGWAAPATTLQPVAPGAYTAIVTAQGGCSTSVLFTITPPPAPATFSLVPLGPTFSITCFTPTLNLSVNNTANTYTWNGPGISPVVDFSVAPTYSNVGTWSVTATNTVSGCTTTKLFTVGINTIAPVSSINPTFQSITCTNTAVQTVTLNAISPSVNVTHNVLSQQGGIFAANSQTAIYQPGPGTFTHVLYNNVNGCTTTKTFTVFAGLGFPTFSLVSPQNYTLGCTTKSVASIQFIGGNTSPVQGGAVSYTLLPPNSPTAAITGTQSTYTVNIPGTYTAVTKDNTSQCETRIPVSVIQNTFGPSIDTMFIPTQILDCDNPFTVLEGYSDLGSQSVSIGYAWSFPGTPGVLNSNSITIVTNTNAPTNTLIANYTLTIRNNDNTCTSSTVVPMYQNLYAPIARATDGGVPGITCSTKTVVLSNISVTGIPANSNFPKANPVQGYLWEGPTPQVPLQIFSTYTAGVVGIYTLTVKDLNNGCKSFTTIEIKDARQYPDVNYPNQPPPAILDCGATATSMTLNITTPTANLTYSWTAPINASVTGKTTGTLQTNTPGTYTVLVTNTVNGCATTATASTINGSLSAKVDADHETGFAPLAVNFMNNSATSLNTASIVSIWSFGNGSTLTAKSVSISPTTVYDLPGTYTVTIFLAKGACIDTVYKVIKVDRPSQLVIPNVFTPNGDGINDLYFFSPVSNLAEINIKIYDRWGHLVYELVSDKGNIAWDGKNQLGVEVAEGTYFFLVTAKGTDGVDFDKKGTISLFR